MKIEKIGVIVISILILITANIVFYNVKGSLPGKILQEKTRIVREKGIELKVPEEFPEGEWKGNELEGGVSFNQLLEQTRFIQYFVLAWSKKNIEWKTLLPQPRVLPAGKKEEYIFENIRQKEINIASQPVKYSLLELTIIRGCGTKNSNYLVVSEFRLANSERNFVFLGFSEKNKEKEFCRILESVRIINQ